MLPPLAKLLLSTLLLLPELLLALLLALPLLTLLLWMRLWPWWRRMLRLGERGRRQQNRCQTAHDYSPAQHTRSPFTGLAFSANMLCRHGPRTLRIRSYVVLHLQFVEHIEIGVQLVVLLQRLQIADGGSWLYRQTQGGRLGGNGFSFDPRRLIDEADDERSG